MAILTLPTTPLFDTAEFRLITNSIAHTSPLNKTTQTLKLLGAHWIIDAVLPRSSRAEVAAWMSLLTELEGMTGRVYIGDPLGKTPRGTAKDTPGTPIVDGAGQTGSTLAISGGPISETGWLLVDDYIHIDLPSGGRSLHKIKTDVDTDGSGDATLPIKPALRESPANGQAVAVANTSCVMRLLDDEQARWSERGLMYEIAFTAIESFNTG